MDAMKISKKVLVDLIQLEEKMGQLMIEFLRENEESILGFKTGAAPEEERDLTKRETTAEMMVKDRMELIAQGIMAHSMLSAGVSSLESTLKKASMDFLESAANGDV